MKLKRFMFIVLGCIGLGLGAVGAVVPLLPAFPFLLVLRRTSFARQLGAAAQLVYKHEAV